MDKNYSAQTTLSARSVCSLGSRQCSSLPMTEARGVLWFLRGLDSYYYIRK